MDHLEPQYTTHTHNHITYTRNTTHYTTHTPGCMCHITSPTPVTYHTLYNTHPQQQYTMHTKNNKRTPQTKTTFNHNIPHTPAEKYNTPMRHQTFCSTPRVSRFKV
uniref:Uncharacterized protein n=1 Tax=Cacopsylla melanoneura TaxID=428564 RepID=A0A8D8Q9U7_9HEMI